MANLVKMLLLALLFFISTLLSSCNDELIINEAKYEPKIVIAGLIYPEKRVEEIQITRNYHLSEEVNIDDLFLHDAQVSITDLESNTSYKLVEYKNCYVYMGRELFIGYGKTYRLDVSAVIDGKSLKASSTTTTPQKGFRIAMQVQSLKYREKDSSGVIKQFEVIFKTTEGASFYMFSLCPEEPKLSNFIYDNPYFDLDTAYVSENFSFFAQRYFWINNLNPAEIHTYEISWLNLWFYDAYEITVYAGDLNYYNFIATYGNIQELDGNFHEPRFNIEGDGIGYFGSAIAGRTYIEVLR